MNVMFVMDLLPDTKNCGLRMHRECWERFTGIRALAIPSCIMAHGQSLGLWSAYGSAMKKNFSVI